MDGGEAARLMDTPSLSYVLAHPTALGLSLRHPAALLLLVAIAVFVLRPHAGSRLAGTLRSAAYAALVLALAGLALTTRMPSDRLTVVAAVDVSPSIDATGRAWARRYLAQLQARLVPGDELAVVAFADGVELLRAPGPPAPLPDALPAPPVPATDLGAALDAAMALLPADGARRVVLLTDGNQTRGDGARRIPWLRAAGVRVDAAVPPHEAVSDVRVERVIAPAMAGVDSPVPVRVVAHNDGPLRPAVLNVYLDGEIADSSAVELPPGRSAMTLASRLVDEGSHRLRAELRAQGDAQPANDSRDVGITLRDPTRALVLTTRPRSVVATALARKEVRADVRPPGALKTVEALRDYHLVVLEDLTAADLPPPTLDVLERWVRDHGGGLLVAGGGALYGDPALARTALKRLLPVTLEPNRPKPGLREPLALFLVIDRSNSMGYNSRVGTLRDGEKLRYAKEAALAVVRQLKDQDLVGVIVFDSKPHEIAPLRPLAQNRAALEDLLPRLVENGGTDFYDALASAREQLAQARVRQRHIILLTDGDTNRAAPEEYRALTKQIAADHIGVTTIRIGDNTVNLELLQGISSGTGGEFHYVENARQLPDLMLREATKALAPEANGAETFHPRVSDATQPLQGLDEPKLPPLSGYAYARPRPGAEVLLHVPRLDRRDPLLAVWQYGLGRVAAFTASPRDDAEAWVAWPAFTKFWSQLGHWTARQHADDEVAIDARRSGGVTELDVRAFGPSADAATLTARLALGETAAREVPLVPSEPRRFTARLLDLAPGRYPLTLIKRTASGAVSQRTQMVTVPAADDTADAEFRRSEPDLALLERLTASTGGSLNAPADRLLAREPGTRAAIYPLAPWLVPLSMLLFLADTALRLRRR
ncbi:VWA domain-containing protein [bacterium]|nr:VWA domain-containing protein [bacterium]